MPTKAGDCRPNGLYSFAPLSPSSPGDTRVSSTYVSCVRYTFFRNTSDGYTEARRRLRARGVVVCEMTAGRWARADQLYEHTTLVKDGEKATHSHTATRYPYLHLCGSAKSYCSCSSVERLLRGTPPETNCHWKETSSYTQFLYLESALFARLYDPNNHGAGAPPFEFAGSGLQGGRFCKTA